MNKSIKIFISHTTEDTPKAKKIYEILKKRGFAPWIDCYDIKAGEKWDYSINKALKEAHFIIVCLSRLLDEKRSYINKEIKLALEYSKEKKDHDIYIFPISIDNCKIPDELSAFQGINYSNDGLEKLIQGICKGMEQRKLYMKIKCNECKQSYKLPPSVIQKKVNSISCKKCHYKFSVFPSSEIRPLKSKTIKTSQKQSLRYFITITKENNQYVGHVSKGNLSSDFQINDMAIGPEQIIYTEDSGNIRLKSIVDAITRHDKKWLAKYFTINAQNTIGNHLFKQVFSTKKIVDLCPEGMTADIRIITNDEYICRLPWMLMATGSVYLTNTRFSITLSNDNSTLNCELPISPKILIIAPQYRDKANDPTFMHVKRIERLLSSADSQHMLDVNLKLVINIKDIEQELRINTPNIIYYYGHSKFFSKLFIKNNFIGQIIDELSERPMLMLINCNDGDTKIFPKAAIEIHRHIPCVISSKIKSSPDIAELYGIKILQLLIIKGYSPHNAILSLRGENIDNMEDRGYSVPYLHCRYNLWKSNPPVSKTRLERDPHWRLKLDRRSQFHEVFGQTFNMCFERKPPSIAYLWYGSPEKRVDLFHNRLLVEFQEKLEKIVVYTVYPDWPLVFTKPNTTFENMIKQAFKENTFEDITLRIQKKSRQRSGLRTLVYVCHKPVTSPEEFHPRYLKQYLTWWNDCFIPLLPKKAHALLGISYEIQDPKSFSKWINEEGISQLRFSKTIFRVLDEFTNVKPKDIDDFMHDHQIYIPDDLKDVAINDIIEKTDGSYDLVLKELMALESNIWKLLKNQSNHGNGSEKKIDLLDAAFSANK